MFRLGVIEESLENPETNISPTERKLETIVYGESVDAERIYLENIPLHV